MDNKLCSRYLGGIIICKGDIDKLYLPKSITFDDDRYNIISSAIIKLVNDGSSMSSIVLLDAIRTEYLKVGEEEQWPELSGWFESFVYAAEECNVSVSEVKELYDIIQRQKLSQQTKLILEKITEKVEFDEEDIDTALKSIRLIKAVYPSKDAKLDEQSAEAVRDALNNSAGVIPYEFSPIDEEIAGICRKEITIMAGRPSHGKTSIVCQFVLNWIQSNRKVLFISKEMPAERLMHKFFANIGNIPSDEIKRGVVEDSEFLEQIATSFVRKYKDRLFVYDDVYKSSEIEHLILKHKPDVVVDDFIQMSDLEGEPMRQGLFTILKHYKALAKENNLAFVVLSQLNRNIEGRDDPIPRMSDLAESGALEQLAADVLFIYYGYKVTYAKEDKNRVKIIVAKARYGESTVIPLGFDGSHMRYYELPKFMDKGNI